MRGTLIAGALFASVLSFPAVGHASSGLFSIAGYDYSQDLDNIQTVMACDQESDSHAVHADFHIVGSGSNHQIRDGNGANNNCAYTGLYPAHIYNHRIVEEAPLMSDQFGPWVYPS
jgi:hypothetical protein